ncbi:FtsW/RodA/SpoVE family cell cycle protein [Phycisphaerales bacterium AB-hyl4]|uniref:Probable peptidoglycan glycosyltransferase FtsW n=1 Tax=Natronomicrosphaera hydrolytica TaxID=3242702 RepID=A0ABV4U4I2_9BACT
MLRPAHIVQLAVVALLGIGVVMVHSASLHVGRQPVTEQGLLGMFMTRHTLYAGIAIAVMLLASRINVRELFRHHGWTNPLWLIVLVALGLTAATLIPGVGVSVKGASRWLHLGPTSWGLTFQPSELIKWTIVLAIAWWCARRRGVMHRFWHGLLPALLLIAVACALVVIEDWGTAALIGVVAICLLIAGGAKLWHMAMMAPPAIIAAVAMIIHSPYRVTRLTTFLDPWQDPAGAGYHSIQSMLAIAQGGLTGRGLGNGIQKFGYLPEDTTDFIFAVICEELGLAGAGLVVALYLVILWVGLGIVKDCRDTFARLVGLGALLIVGLQAALNIAVVTVVVPTKGIALPLVSAGGTGWILTAFGLGLVAALDNANYEQQAHDEFDALELTPVEVEPG